MHVTHRRVVPGIYDTPVTKLLEQLLESSHLAHQREGMTEPDAPGLLARALHDRLLHSLRAASAKDGGTKLEAQVAVANSVLELLAREVPAGGADSEDQVSIPAQRLVEVFEPGTTPAPAPRPGIPVGTSDLIVNARHDLRLGSEILLELASADRVDLLCSFLKWSGFRLVEDALKAFLRRRPGGLRVLTTAYMGATERRALDALVALGATVRVSFDVDRTRLHAKAWLFHRDSGFSTASIGSSNLSHAAMLDGLEWNVRLSQIDNRLILEKFRTVFDQYWDDKVFEQYDPARDRERWDKAVQRQSEDSNRFLLSLQIDPRPHQVEILESLAAEREKGHTRNLVVAATGTGKTIVAALDYRRLRSQLGPRASLLFVAHRHEILQQSQALFRVALSNPVFGHRPGDGEGLRAHEHVFASIQSLHADRLSSLAPDAFDMVIVDEFHHAAAPSYAALLEHLRPKFLLGLTATPERNDGRPILHWFDDRIAAELRLWKALDQGLLSPFQYFGVNDDTDLSHVTWTPTGYSSAELRNVYTANDLWAKRVLQELHRRVSAVSKMRALGFCVDIEHAEFMRDRFNEAGLASAAVSQRTSDRARHEALARLRGGELRAVFSVDLFNEGIDLPDVDTVLFLRPTESPTVFLQQLGRGLRRSRDKDCLTVLDFIGGAHRKFRFDRRFQALLGGTRRQVLQAVEQGFPHLPAGCSIQLDQVAQKTVIANIRSALQLGQRGLVDDLVGLGRDVSLREFLNLSGADLEDVYAAPGRTWTQLRRLAGLPTPPTLPAVDEEPLARALARLLHLDDPLRLDAFRVLLLSEMPPVANDLDFAQRSLAAALGHDDLGSMANLWASLWAAPAIRAELITLLDLLDDRRGRTLPLGGRLAKLALRVHATYTRDEVMAALDLRDNRGYLKGVREGVLHVPRLGLDLLFVTLEKSEAEFTPTTMYRDYPITPLRFHWETQPHVHEDTATGQRYLTHAASGQSVLLFVRQRREVRPQITAPFVLLGPVKHLRHEGAKPMAIEWELEEAIPAGLFQEIKVAAG